MRGKLQLQYQSASNAMPGSTSVQYDLQNSIEFKYTDGVAAAAKTENRGQAAGKGQWKMQARGAG